MEIALIIIGSYILFACGCRALMKSRQPTRREVLDCEDEPYLDVAPDQNRAKAHFIGQGGPPRHRRCPEGYRLMEERVDSSGPVEMGSGQKRITIVETLTFVEVPPGKFTRLFTYAKRDADKTLMVDGLVRASEDWLDDWKIAFVEPQPCKPLSGYPVAVKVVAPTEEEAEAVERAVKSWHLSTEGPQKCDSCTWPFGYCLCKHAMKDRFKDISP